MIKNIKMNVKNTKLTMTSFSMTRAVFVNYNMPRIVDNNISYLKLTIYRQLLCWI